MKAIIIGFILLGTISTNAQEVLDTIYANDKKNVALFFPNPVRQGITGAAHFVFTYNREKEQYFGLLQAKPGKNSNLLAVTNDGKVYSYILKYSQKLPRLNYFVDGASSIGNEKPKINPQLKEKITPDPYTGRITYFQKFSDYQLKLKYIPISTKRKNGVKLQLQKMVYNTTEVYVVMEITNRSGIDFEIDFLKVYKTNGTTKKKASYQRLEQTILYRHKIPDFIKNEQSQRFVLVLSKFVLGS
ncbi:conjugative transposon protein TraN [Algibacter lectus]|uniref:Conjugative transposon protein TraN n=1 Tax=Algibacter lectus TaxID=221126 RepID=A0A090WJS7_9FLAO|nr:conjugative transposon protein TraN [Algibacter lectus]